MIVFGEIFEGLGIFDKDVHEGTEYAIAANVRHGIEDYLWRNDE
jgi:hypothetical protein